MILSLLFRENLFIELIVHDENIVSHETKLIAEFLNAFNAINAFLVNLSTSIGVLCEHGCTLTRFEKRLDIRNYCQIANDVNLIAGLAFFDVLVT